ncbi:TPA: putative DNA binding domain-containing protein [Streptococcus suis]|uniref:Putative transcriptional regulator n=1 Tax=Streptococcus suis TaxID=1307 RepID=A0A0Z8F489_STRSU|nr:ATP-binding protein [Streptococcus suis]NQH39310.1 ATP-dependent DNA helicase [Streptococcus suis]NQP51770.1 ATP-dependent DNA helicase [Streptococcus suis]CYU73524.1 putative transcriptional regulator [Streptococcus suis]HEL1626178.1 putative DNA binding domain-containing protein [Streptococcus suis]HEM2768432.1 putative DNA binding domain-containing protein [Streptococcus suis]
MKYKKPLSHYQFSPENQYLDRKSARKKPSELLKHLIAFANADGGQLVIGIEDEKQENIITGFKDGRAYPIDDFKKIDREMRETPLDLSFEEIPVINHKGEEDFILVISVELSSNRVIAAPNDDVYLRQGDESVKLSYEQRTQLSYDKGQRFFEDEFVPDASLEDIDETIVQDFKSHFDLSERSTEEILKARRFLVNGKLTKAAILLFGKYPSAFFPQARVRFQRFDGTDMGTGSSFNVIKEVTFDDALPTLIIKVRDFIRTQLREFQYLDDNGQFQILPEYPEFAWFEGVVNAVTHRDYSVYGDHIRVLMFDDRLEIHSPGKLPNIVTVENIKHERFSRNPRIARTLTEFGWVREMNEGVKRIYSEMESAFLHEPKFSEPGNKVVLTLENNIVSRHLRTRDSLEKQFSDFDNLNSDEQAIIHYMYNSGERMTTAKAVELTGRSRRHIGKVLQKLTDQGLLKWYGNSKNDKNQYYTLASK